MVEVLVTLAVLVALFAGVAIGLYFIVRALFMRATDRAARHLESLLIRAARSARAATAGRVATMAARRVAEQMPSGFARYAEAAGSDEQGARQEFQQTIERVARLMDSFVKLPILGPVGLDAVLGLFPFVGDATSAAVSLALIARSLKYGIPRELVAKMLANVLVDLLIGAVPLVGDLADIWFRANVRNAALLREYLEKHP